MQEELNTLLLGVRLDVVDLAYIQDLLEKGAQIDARDSNGQTALMKFASHSFWPECELLIKHSRFYNKNELRNEPARSKEQKEQVARQKIQEKLSRLKPLMREARRCTQDKEIKEILDPKKLDANFRAAIEENIRKEVGLPTSTWLSWLSDK